MATGKKEYSTIDIPMIYPNEAVEIVKHAHGMRTPLILWGPPGVGKSAVVRQAADELNQALQSRADKGTDKNGEPATFHLKEVYLSRMTAADVGGLPTLDHDKKTTTFYLPDLLTDLPGEHGMIFFDELTTADPQTRSAVLNLILEGKLGNFTLPKGWMCIGAANPKEYGGIYGDLGAAMNNRLMHFEMGADFEHWKDWAVEHDIDPHIIGFLANGNARYFMCTPEEFKTNPRAFPSPRNWERISTMVKTVKDDKILSKMIFGAIGPVASSQFMTWKDEAKDLQPMTTYFEIARNGDRKDIIKALPKKIGSLYIIACACPAYATTKNGEEAMKILNAMYFDDKSKQFAGIPIHEIGICGWTLFCTAALTAAQSGTGYHAEQSKEFDEYNTARTKEVGPQSK